MTGIKYYVKRSDGKKLLRGKCFCFFHFHGEQAKKKELHHSRLQVSLMLKT